MAADWGLVDTLLGGTRAMRRAGRRYLPQWPAEDDASYQARLASATLFPAYARTVSVLAGKPFGKPLTIGEDVPQRLRPWLEDVDLQGRNLHSFAAEICVNALSHGLCGILVDCPPNRGARSVAEERAAGIRPYMVHVRPGSILGWRTRAHGAATQLAQLRLLECVEEEDGPFTAREVEQVRVLEPGRWAVYRRQVVDGAEAWRIHEEGTTTLPVIPFVPVYGRRRGFMLGAPPMLELAHANVEHWQNKSDQQTILHVARVPLLFARGLGDAQITVGANSLIQTGSETAELRYVEHSGAAIEAGRRSLLDLEDRMRQTGAELLVIRPGNTTEAQTIADNEQGMCDLQRIMQAVEDSLDTALALMARWVGEKDGGHVSIYRDFGAATLAEASASLLFQMQSAGALSHQTLLGELKRRGILSPDIEVATEIARAQAQAR
ncbi:DUF4055 domain-containing protein [Rhodovastum atsumiense]|uniref:DUF4055 domain-containing protein n=2 Tax=Rhodovastum atsumiense TaxID=504468 RepID=A0A5M6IYW0_9PROT|nr:DUF4055 domain-containing protein [Rhodovastum atsumiense]